MQPDITLDQIAADATHNLKRAFDRYPHFPRSAHGMDANLSCRRHGLALALSMGQRVWFREEESWLCMPRRRHGRAWRPTARTIVHNAASGCARATGLNIGASAGCGTRGLAKTVATNSRPQCSSLRMKKISAP